MRIVFYKTKSGPGRCLAPFTIRRGRVDGGGTTTEAFLGFWQRTIKINKLRRLPRSVHLLFGTSRESCTSCPVIVVVVVVASPGWGKLENGFKYN